LIVFFFQDGTITKSGNAELDHPAVMHTVVHVISALGILEYLENEVQSTYLFALVGAVLKLTLKEQGYDLPIITPRISHLHVQDEFYHIIGHIRSMGDDRKLIFEEYKRSVVDCAESQMKSTGTLL